MRGLQRSASKSFKDTAFQLFWTAVIMSALTASWAFAWQPHGAWFFVAVGFFVCSLIFALVTGYLAFGDSEQHVSIGELMREGAGTPPPPPPSRLTRARPNFVCTDTYQVGFVDQNGILMDQRRISHKGQRNGVVIVAEIYNAFDEKLNPTKVSAVSAQIIYEPPNGPPITVPRGTWLNEGTYKKGFDVNGHQELVIAGYGQGLRPVNFILIREHKRGVSLVSRSSFLARGDHRVIVRLVNEAENIVYKEFKFILKLIREPQVYMELERVN
jgi:hypothetical protein